MNQSFKPQVGMRFVHSTLRNGKAEMVCEVTRVSTTTVYFTTATGQRRSTDVMCFGSICRKLVVPEMTFSAAS